MPREYRTDGSAAITASLWTIIADSSRASSIWADGGDALIWGDNGSSDHLWQIVPAGSAQYKIENYNSGLLLGVLNQSTSSGAQVLQWEDNGTPDHLWSLTAS